MTQGLSQSQLAEMVCMSERQIKEIEEGGMVSFYSASIKHQSAKKIAKILNLCETECFESTQQATLVSTEPPIQDLDKVNTSTKANSIIETIKRWFDKT